MTRATIRLSSCRRRETIFRLLLLLLLLLRRLLPIAIQHQNQPLLSRLRAAHPAALLQAMMHFPLYWPTTRMNCCLHTRFPRCKIPFPSMIRSLHQWHVQNQSKERNPTKHVPKTAPGQAMPTSTSPSDPTPAPHPCHRSQQPAASTRRATSSPRP